MYYIGCERHDPLFKMALYLWKRRLFVFFKSHVCLQVLPPFFSPNFVCQQTAKFLDGKSWTDFKIRIPSVLPLAGAAAAATTTQPTMLIARVRHCQRRFAPPFSVVLVLKVPAKWGESPKEQLISRRPISATQRRRQCCYYNMYVVSASEAI